MLNKRDFLTVSLVLLSAVFLMGMTGESLIPVPGNLNKGGAAAVQGQCDVQDSPYYKVPDFYNMRSSGSLTLLEHYKTYQQSQEYTCGPAAALTVVNYFQGMPQEDEMQIAKIMGTGTVTSSHPGTNTAGMVKYFKKLGWEVHSCLSDPTPKDYPAFKAFVLKNLQNQVPIMVENVDWGGHWRVIIGLDTMGDQNDDNDVLIMVDPYDVTDHKQDGYNIVPLERFYYMWFDAHLFKESEREKQWLTARPPVAKK